MGRGDIGNNGVANDGNGKSEEHHDAPEFEAIRGKCNENYTFMSAVSWTEAEKKKKKSTARTCDRGGNGVWDNRPQLGLVGTGCDLQIVENGWELRHVSHLGLKKMQSAERTANLQRDQSCKAPPRGKNTR